jgi:HK97 family phage major capsid protein
MNLEQMKARLAEISAKLAEFANPEANVNDADVETINALTGEFESLSAKVQALEKMANITAIANSSAGRKTAPTNVVATQTQAPKKVENFENVGEYFRAVAMSSNGNVDKRLANTAQEKFAEDGAFLIPADIRTDIQTKIMGDESLLPMTFKLTTGSNTLTMPVDEIAPWDGTGIQAYWEGEGIPHTGTKHGLKSFQMRLFKLTAYVTVTEELLEDAPALESYIRAKAPAAILHKVNSAIIGGDGVGKPIGFLKSPFRVKVAKEVGQAADTIVAENIVKMFSRILPGSIGSAVWIINPSLLEQIRLLKFNTSPTSLVPAYLPPSGLAGAPYGTLMGRPVLPFMGATKAAGDEGDISFVDLKYYYSATKTAGIKSDMSTHVHFDKDLTAFKFSMRVAGQCPYQAPVTTENGGYQMSAFVTLEDR